MSINNIPVIGKSLLILAAFGLFMFGATAFMSEQVKSINASYIDAIDHEAATAIATAQANNQLNIMRAALAELQLSNTDEGNERALSIFKDSHARFVALIDTAAKQNPALAPDLQATKQRALTLLDSTCGPAIKAGLAATQPADLLAAQSLFLQDCAPGVPELTAAMQTMTQAGQAVVQQKEAALSVTAGRTVIIMYGMIVLGLAVVMSAGFVAIRSWISRPLTGLSATMSRLSQGDLSTVIAGVGRRDEIGTMAQAVQVFKDAAIEKLRLERQADFDRQVAEQERARAEAARQVVAQQLATVVDSLAGALGQLSAGDLTCDMTEAFAPEYERLRIDFNAAVSELRTIISTIITNTGALRSGTGEISQAADDLSRRTEQQAASLEQTAAALDQITATVRKTAEGAKAAQTIVASAKTEAEHGGGVVRDAVAAMNAIETSAREIGQIIGVIDEIAFQTSLLALNAGVEAARAGDAGRGFAVVASEVRALAQRCAQAAKEIKGLIGSSTSHVGRGVTLVQETGAALGRILGQVTQINGAVAEIVASAQDQASSLAQVNTAVNQMDQVTQQNAAMVEQSTAASHSLAHDTADLEQLTARFKTGPEQQVRSAINENAPIRKAASRAFT